MLLNHYQRVARVFSHRTSDQLPEEDQLTTAEKAAIIALLLRMFQTWKREQAEIIARTTAERARRSLLLGRAEIAKIEEETGEPLSPREKALRIGLIFARYQRGRLGGIVMGETQKSAEMSKLQEVVNMTRTVTRYIRPGVAPAAGAVPRPLTTPPPTHVWVTKLDDKVRTSPLGGHVAAHGQVRPVGEPFSVMGELLLVPKDQSLGATARNVANCRCGAVVNIDGVIARRADMREE